MTSKESLRTLPSVETLIASVRGQFPHAVAAAEARRLIAEQRERVQRGEAPSSDLALCLRARLQQLDRPSLRRVINATGVILHTNLGRAPLPSAENLSGYANLEYDLETGRRGKRDVHVGPLLHALLDRPAIVVNNNAAAVYLVLAELAKGHEVIVSRGELIEIGDGFRIPEIMAASGAILREVGTTNRTGVEDYRHAMNERTRLIMRVHPSNFHVTGFTGKPALRELSALAREHHVPLYEDLGSGCIVDLRPYGISEPLVSGVLSEGADVVSFSTDKLLGGPQAGIIAGDPGLIQRVRRNPMFRALRLDKLILQSLSDTLRNLLFERYQQIPALTMIALTAAELKRRADAMRHQLPDLDCSVIEGESVIGGGSTPDQSLPTWLLAIRGNAVDLEKRLRGGDPPVIARIENGQLLIDPRTVLPDEEPQLFAALRAAV